MIEPISLTFTVATFVVAVFVAWFTWQNHNARLPSELPEVRIDPLDQGLYRPEQVMTIYVQLKTHHPNFGWCVTRVEVIEASPKATTTSCLVG